MAGFKSQIISGCHIAVESSFPGEGTPEGALVEQERSLVGYHLPQTPATVNSCWLPSLKSNSPVILTMVFTGQRHYFTGPNTNEDCNVHTETKCPDSPEGLNS